MSNLVDTVLQDDRWAALNLGDLADIACRASLTSLGLDPEDFEISLLGCDDVQIAGLNSNFRDKQAATNVLSWPSAERGSDIAGCAPTLPATGEELGDIAISYETCIAEAKTADKPPQEHVTHLLVHGTLHLLGYDHISDEDATLMEQLETQILASLGHPDPYRVD